MRAQRICHWRQICRKATKTAFQLILAVTQRIKFVPNECVEPFEERVMVHETKCGDQMPFLWEDRGSQRKRKLNHIEISCFFCRAIIKTEPIQWEKRAQSGTTISTTGVWFTVLNFHPISFRTQKVLLIELSFFLFRHFYSDQITIRPQPKTLIFW
jgi:hypothetical protein